MRPSLHSAEYPKLEALPPPAHALFGQDSIFSTEAWFRASAAHALPAGATAIFLVFSTESRTLAVVPLQKGPAEQLSSLTTPYTCLWGPLLARDLSPQEVAAIAEAFAEYCRPGATVRLDALDPTHVFWPALTTAARAARFATLRFDHFGNWHEPIAIGLTWEHYLAARPGALREAIRRKTARLCKDQGFRVEIVNSPENLQQAINAYEDIYEHSWKQPEPFPDFNPAFMRDAALAGTLRLALLHARGRAIAAQLWTVHNGVAAVMKLAHRQDEDALSPGTVLTAHVIRHLLETEHITAIDFGRGDDPYKQQWTTLRQQREGLVLARLSTWDGSKTAIRHWLGKLRKLAVRFR